MAGLDASCTGLLAKVGVDCPATAEVEAEAGAPTRWEVDATVLTDPGVATTDVETCLEVERGRLVLEVEPETTAGGPSVGGERTDVRLSREGIRGRG